jgi:enoyl-CoA hydratase/carnithine racemase
MPEQQQQQQLIGQRLAMAILKFINYYGVSDSAQLVDRARALAERIVADNPDTAMYDALDDLREAVSYSGYLKHDNEKLATAMEKANNALVLARKVY